MEPLLPKGMRDFGPEEKLARDALLSLLKVQFERFGFNPLETPVLERYETLSAKYAGGAEILKETFRLTDQGERELGLRYDLTVPLARYIASNPDVKLPFKRYAIGTVYRDGPVKLGRYREFCQCDCDIVGADTPAADAECVQLALAVFRAINQPFVVHINHVGLLRRMLEHDGVPVDRTADAMLILDKLKKTGEEGVVAELEAAGISGGAARRVIAVAQLATNDERIAAIREGYGALPELERVEQVLRLAAEPEVAFDPSLARGLSYYTSIVFEAYLKGSPVTSSVAGGGRYDRMIGGFLGRPGEYPAVGISFGLEPITEALKAQNAAGRTTVVEAYVIPIKTPQESNAVAQALRAGGVNTDIDIMDRGISKNLEYASVTGIPYVVFVGRKELDAGKLKLRDMRTGEETLLDRDALVERLTKRS
jgi:histidyl-tRNA synthetase